MSICNLSTQFKEVHNIGDDFLLNIIESNLKMFLDWSFLNVGAWFDVGMTDQTIFGGRTHAQLLPVYDPSYADGQVWQGIRKDWVWENGFEYNENSPIEINSVDINGTTVNKTGNFVINYPLGRIIFNTPKSLTSTIKANYSYRFVQVHRASDSPWFNIIQQSSYNTANQDIVRTEDGEWAIGSNHRIQLPAIVIESLPRSRSFPYEIGSNSLIIEQDIGFYILAENKNDRNKLLDILRLQQDHNILLFNTNTLAQNDKYPLDYNGDLKNSPLMYPDIVTQYTWRKCWIKNVNLFELDSPNPNLHQGMVRMTTEIISN
ncbi:hypothetical protein EB001_19775 [bacterium]|nr:hypothetical protein [bacterium]